MPPQVAPPPVAPPQRRSYGGLIAILLVLLLLAAGIAWYFMPNGIGGNSWGSERYLVQGDTGPSYVFANGTFTEAERGAEPQARFDAPGWPPVVIEQTEDGLRACSADACDTLISFGSPIERAVAYTVFGDTLILAHPLVDDIQGYTLIPATPARIEPAFLIHSPDVRHISGMIETAPGSNRFLIVRSDGNQIVVCSRLLSNDRTSFANDVCAAQVTSVTNPVLTKLP